MVLLTLQHLWTKTGGPLEWRFDEEDEEELRRLLESLAEHRADPHMPSAVLLASTPEDFIGAWNRAGAKQLGFLIGLERRDQPWLDVRVALHDAVSGP